MEAPRNCLYEEGAEPAAITNAIEAYEAVR